MATIDIVNIENKKSGFLDLPSAVFETEVRPHLYHAEVRRQLAERRAGTHSTKNRAMVSGGGVKPYRQKGTGRARQGTIRAPHYAGGGVVFGPVPRGYSHKLPKKVRRAALRSALSQRLQESALIVVDELQVEGFRTRKMAEILASLGLGGITVLIVIAESNPTVEASARNLPGVSVLRAEGLNVYDVLRHKHMLVTKDAIAVIEAKLASGSAGGGAR